MGFLTPCGQDRFATMAGPALFSCADFWGWPVSASEAKWSRMAVVCCHTSMISDPASFGIGRAIRFRPPPRRLRRERVESWGTVCAKSRFPDAAWRAPRGCQVRLLLPCLTRWRCDFMIFGSPTFHSMWFHRVLDWSSLRLPKANNTDDDDVAQRSTVPPVPGDRDFSGWKQPIWW